MKESNSNLSLHKWPFRDKMAQMHRMQDVLTRLNKFHNKGRTYLELSFDDSSEIDGAK